MATVKPIKPEKPVDYVAYEPVMIAVSKARAMAWVLEELGANEASSIRNNPVEALKDAPRPEDTRDWLQSVVAEALHAAHDEIEPEYRKLGTNLLAKEAAQAEIERVLRPPDHEKPKDDA